MTDKQRLRYPIGEFERPAEITRAHIAEWIADISLFPGEFRRIIAPLTLDQLNITYRPGGWTVRQVVHHVADSHLNSFIRFKWALTEDRPVIKAYREERWAELADYTRVDVGVSLDLLDALHDRWCALLRSLTEADLQREFVHPESGPVTLAENIGIYAWHGRHHVAHIELTLEEDGE
jgi:hypothetical protein